MLRIRRVILVAHVNIGYVDLQILHNLRDKLLKKALVFFLIIGVTCGISTVRNTKLREIQRNY